MKSHQSERVSKSDITSLFKRQQEFAPTLALTGYKERRKKLERMLEYLLRHAEDVEKATCHDMRKPVNEAILSEIITLTSELRYHLKHLKRWMKPHRVPTPLLAIGTSSYIRYEAKGTSLIISPWNYPVSLALKPLIAAVSAGCTAIIKPSEFTPHASGFVSNFVRNLFIPEEISVVEGGKDVATDLLTLPFDHIFFIGSSATGKVVMKAASDHLSSVSLELGGKSPALVDETADISASAAQIAWAKFLNNGQTCIAPDYVLVHKNVSASFLTAITGAVQAMYNPEGKGIKQSGDYARIVHRDHFQRLKAMYENAVQNGASTVCGGAFDESELFIGPTVLSGVSITMSVMKEEIFGPILPVISYDSLEEAVKIIHSIEKPLALYIYSRNDAHISYILDRTSSGNALVNEALMQFQHPEIPFGGIRNSGMGKANGFFGFQEFSNAKGVITRNFGTMKFLYPPFTSRKTKLLKWVQKYL